MRIVFLVVLLAGTIFYSYIAFSDLSFLSRTGRLGPGFFPRIIGVSAAIITLWVIIEEMRRGLIAEGTREQWQDVAILIALALGYAVLLKLLGGFVATLIVLAVTLSVLNPRRHITNALISGLLPAGIYLLFDKLLNASMPPALFELPL